MGEAESAELIAVLEQARELLADPANDYSWSSWAGPEAALQEIDRLRASIANGAPPLRAALAILFAPTGPIQEVGLQSGWGDAFLEVAERFDAAAERFYR